MDPVNTHGVFSWNELMTPDPARAADFYHQLFGWTFQTRAMPDLPEGYRVAHLEGEPVAGIMPMPPDAPPAMPPHWGSYVTVDNVDETAGECAALGGRVLLPPTDIPEIGRFAMLQDPQGAVFGVIGYLPAVP
ncbi:hypothetical protein MASR2M32_23950 [Sphaerotilus sulfidivorans]|jgi:predicted enzyme related to lactoylglutathione lyase|uniref:VOC family protein n=1 Tax=Sphaerotilus sp. FB-3 TaxID=2913396 RepID=UPI001C7E3EE8|nr:VOC family protein [Sphaerotilus sp. FB-3]GIX50978.1 hypothetical protein CQA4T8M7_02340 [Sphaerotilus natans]GKQ56585.1 hypothetical protein QMTAC487_04430 [Sphaerotilus sp. FB-3]